MWKQKLGISLGNHYDIPTVEVVDIVHSVGFDAVSPEWEDCDDLAALAEYARSLGMAVQSVHAPYGGAAKMWSEDPAVYTPVLDELTRVLDDCHAIGAPVVVMHAWIGFDNIPAPTQCGIDHYRILVDRARAYGMKIAFENTEGEDHLFALLDAFADCDNVGYCWDSGHEMCYNHSMDLLGMYGSRLIMTHVNDNLGISRFDGRTFWTDDLHLLPYDGVGDWDYNIARLKKSAALEYLNFELLNASKPDRHENDAYAAMTLTEYFTAAYMRACRIAYRLTRSEK
ncbi:MAG: sugar phosphate isomerase/epimerase [Clostridia bacterium]|nr:sugar phosphate isomerase/epimerase [Clostridia bacterium]